MQPETLELFTRKKTSSEPINLGGARFARARGAGCSASPRREHFVFAKKRSGPFLLPGARLRLGANTSCSQKSTPRGLRVLYEKTSNLLRICGVVPSFLHQKPLKPFIKQANEEAASTSFKAFFQARLSKHIAVRGVFAESKIQAHGGGQ